MATAQQQQFADPKQTVIMSGYEFTHLARLAANDFGDTVDAERKAKLRSMSQSRYKNWKNTLEAIREQKKAARIKRMEEVERAQQLVDESEANFQEESRRKAIERANRILYEETDRVKNFHSGLLLSTALKERAAQIHVSRRKKQQQKEVEETHFRHTIDGLRTTIEREHADDSQRKAKSRELAVTQLAQLDEYRDRQRTQRQEEIKEGERIKKISQEALREAREMERRRQERMRENNREYLRANQEQQKLKIERKRLDALEDSKIAAFAAEKDRMTEVRKQHETARFRAKQQRFETMLKRQYDHLQRLKNDEDKRVERQVEELKERSDALEHEEENRRNALKAQIKVSREQQLKRRQAERERNRIEDQTMAAEWKSRNRELEEHELDVERKTIENAVKLQQFLREQVRLKEERMQRERQSEVEEAEALARARATEELVFQEYARAHMQQSAEQGKTVVPLKLALIGEQMRSMRA